MGFLGSMQIQLSHLSLAIYFLAIFSPPFTFQGTWAFPDYPVRHLTGTGPFLWTQFMARFLDFTKLRSGS